MAGRKSTYQKNVERYIKEYGEYILRGLLQLTPEERQKFMLMLEEEDKKSSQKETSKREDG